jgi:hypothetical protein
MAISWDVGTGATNNEANIFYNSGGLKKRIFRFSG